ncbi:MULTISPECIES: hypothetical protein [unclassified Pantoea]|uniref:hypothetical protein n=1 Tax=unclassified Pantoea TaxID=2630326 RepID=UPI0012328A94|nr:MULTISPECIES: hypothetical protein [unclassified Pantoea]KAA5932321.1 hypothetical protein F3I59_04645 [Pantoea sp. VH_8]KAA5937382.1 hypothetical protein F3I58_04675 [Pantoea sp. VH_4]
MARIPVYDRQVGIRAPSASQVNTPIASSDQQMLQGGLNSFINAAERLTQQQQAVKNTQYMTDFVNSQTALSQSLNDAQQKSKTGIDYIPASQEIIKQHQQQFFDAHPDLSDSEKQDYTLRWAQSRGQLENQAINWGQNQAKQIQFANLQDTASQIGSQILQDPNSAKAMQDGWVQSVNSSDLDPATKAELQQKGINQWEYAKGLWAANNASEHLTSQINAQRVADLNGKGSNGTLATRNNNPLNLRYSSSNNWLGKGGDNGSGFEQFDTPEHGLRAGIKLMRNHINNGSDTLQSLISKWAPATDNNDPVQYAQSVSQQTGIPVDAKLNPNDSHQMTSVAKAMAKQEGYGADIDDGQASRAWKSVDNPSSLAPGVNLAHLTMEQQQSLYNMAQANNDRAASFAIAEQTKQVALAAKREAAASHASDIMQNRIASGEIPSQADWQNYTTSVQGTQYDGAAAVLRGAMLKTQQLLSMPPAQAQEQLDKMQLDLRQNGGSESEYKVFKAVQQGIDKRRSDLQQNPQAVGALDSGQPLQPLNPADATDQPGAWGQTLLQRQVNADALQQKYGPTAGKNLMTPDELHNTQDAYARMTSDQRIQFWRNTQASSSSVIATRLAREVGGDSLQVAAVAGLATSPGGYRAAIAVDRGNRLLNPVDGAAKVKLPASFDDDTTQAIKSEYPNLSTSQIQRLLPVVKSYHVGSGGDLQRTPNKDALHSIIGSPVKVSGVTVIAPPGTDANAFRDTINSGISQLGSYSQSVRNGLSNGTYALAPDVDGNQTLINAASQRRVIGDDGKPVVIKVSK